MELNNACHAWQQVLVAALQVSLQHMALVLRQETHSRTSQSNASVAPDAAAGQAGGLSAA